MQDAATTTSAAAELMSSGNYFCYIAAQLDLPERLSTNALLEVLNALMTREAFQNLYK